MLERVRRSMQSGFTYVLIAGLIVIFMFFFGMPTQMCSGGAGRTRAHLADVGGESLYTEDVNIVYNRIFGSQRSDEQDKYKQRRVRSLRSLILIKLFADRARERGFRVSTKDLKNYIKDPVRNVEYRYRYGRQGSFNGQYYKAYVQNQLRARIEEYEKFKREELLARQYLAAAATSAIVPKAQLESTRAIRDTKLNLSFVGLNSEKLQEHVAIDDAAIRTFLDENRDRVEKYYEKHKSETYTEPEQVRIRRVYISRPTSSEDQQKQQKVKQKWKEAKKRVLEGDESLAAVASELGESYPGQEKGLMDWSTLDNISKDIRKAVEDSEVGDVQKVVTKHAYMLVKLEDRRKAKTTPLEEVERDIAKTLLQRDQVGDVVSEVRTKLHKKAKETGSLEKALEALQSEAENGIWSSLSVEETGEFTLESEGPPPQLAARMGGQLPSGMGSKWFEIPNIGESKKLGVDAYKHLSEDNPVPDEIYEVDGTKYIVRLKSRKGPSGEDDGAATEPSTELKLETQKTSQLVGRWTAVFGSLNGRMVPPMKSYGDWIDRQLEQAIDDGSVQIHGDRSEIAAMLERSLQPGGGAQGLETKQGGTAGKKKKKGSPIQLKMGGQKGKGKGKGKAQQLSPEQIEKLKKQLRQKKKAAPKGPPTKSGGPSPRDESGGGSDESPSEPSGSESTGSESTGSESGGSEAGGSESGGSESGGGQSEGSSSESGESQAE